VDFARSGAGRFKDYRIEIAIASRAVTFCPFLVKRLFFGEIVLFVQTRRSTFIVFDSNFMYPILTPYTGTDSIPSVFVVGGHVLLQRELEGAGCCVVLGELASTC